MSSSPSDGPVPPRERIFLLVVDESPELRAAVRYAGLRARKTGGRVALLYVMPKGDFEHWMGVGNLVREEARQEAEQLLHKLAALAQELSGSTPILHVREGEVRDELLGLIAEDPSISILVLGASTGPKGPGPLVSSLVGKMSGRLPIPITVVPGALSDEQIDALA